MATETEHKFLLHNLPQMQDFPSNSRPSFSTITQIYLTPPEPGVVARARRRWYRPVGRRSGRMVCHHTTKRFLSGGTNEEHEEPITEHQYNVLVAQQANPACEPIRKYRGVFEWNGLTWEFDEFMNGLAMLEVELPELRADLEIPPFLDIGPEVTRDSRYANAVISRRSWRNGFLNREAFLAALRAAVATALVPRGLEVADQEVLHNESWMVSGDGETLLRFRDRCESPDTDFTLSCMVVRGTKHHCESFWHGEQGEQTAPQIADRILKTIYLECENANWWPEPSRGV